MLLLSPSTSKSKSNSKPTEWELTWRNTWPDKMFEFVLPSINMLTFTWRFTWHQTNQDDRARLLLYKHHPLFCSLPPTWTRMRNLLKMMSMFAKSPSCSMFKLQQMTRMAAEILPCDCYHYKLAACVCLLSFVQPCRSLTWELAFDLPGRRFNLPLPSWSDIRNNLWRRSHRYLVALLNEEPTIHKACANSRHTTYFRATWSLLMYPNINNLSLADSFLSTRKLLSKSTRACHDGDSIDSTSSHNNNSN